VTYARVLDPVPQSTKGLI